MTSQSTESERELLFGIPDSNIMDPVHGGIKLFDYEESAIEHSLFQRLRHVIQNDVLFYAFPGATHTRYVHSIGTMHLAGLFFKSLVRSYLSETKHQKKEIITDEQAVAIKYFYRCIRLAALLHDTGQPPFSHQLENCSRINSIFENAGTFDSLWKDDNWSAYYVKKPLKLTHEHYSIRCAAKILKETPDLPVEIGDVLAIMETTEQGMSQKFREYSKIIFSLFVPNGTSENNPELQIKKLLNLILSGEIDVDKMDYLLRDSHFSGCKYGIYNLDHLLNTLKVGFDEEIKYVGLAIDEKGIGALEDFINSRFLLYTQLYSHKTVTGFKWLLEKAVDEVLKIEANSVYVTRALSDINQFDFFTKVSFGKSFEG